MKIPNITEVEAVIFDLDGVVTSTQNVHLRAWKQAFDDYFSENDLDLEFRGEEHYFDYIDGVARSHAILNYYNQYISKFHKVDDVDAFIQIISASKNQLFLEMLDEKQIDVYQDALIVLDNFHNMGIRLAVASSSKNAEFILRKSGLDRYFELILSGVDVEKLNLNPKPYPDIFIKAIEKLSLMPSQVIIIEDSKMGLEAALGAKVNLVFGINRGALNSYANSEKLMIIDDLRDMCR